MAFSDRADRIGRAAGQALSHACASPGRVGAGPDPARVRGVRKALLELPHPEPRRRRDDRPGLERSLQPDRVFACRRAAAAHPRFAIAAPLAGRELTDLLAYLRHMADRKVTLPAAK